MHWCGSGLLRCPLVERGLCEGLGTPAKASRHGDAADSSSEEQAAGTSAQAPAPAAAGAPRTDPPATRDLSPNLRSYARAVMTRARA